MALTDTEFQHLCRLARLAPSPEASRCFAAECDAVIAYMDKLSEVDTTGVEPLYSPACHAAPMREDVARRSLTREEILANAPQRGGSGESDGGFFLVPRIVEARS